jgi:predicted dehydrogenase
MTAPYRAAIIGAGRIGGLLEDEQPNNTYRKPHGHYAAYDFIDQTEVVAVAGRSAGRLQMFTDRFGISNTYLDYREMIEK